MPGNQLSWSRGSAPNQKKRSEIGQRGGKKRKIKKWDPRIMTRTTEMARTNLRKISDIREQPCPGGP